MIRRYAHQEASRPAPLGKRRQTQRQDKAPRCGFIIHFHTSHTHTLSFLICTVCMCKYVCVCESVCLRVCVCVLDLCISAAPAHHVSLLKDKALPTANFQV
jgi:hypothetical protein